MKQTATLIASNTWCISEFDLVNMFVVEGETRSAVIDTGCGYGNVREVVDSVITKPLSVLLTHKHPDHAGGIYHFRDCPIYMNKDDKELEFNGMGLSNEFRKMYAETRGATRSSELEKQLLMMIPDPEPDCSFDFIDIDDGNVIDLGRRKLECIHTPGHTDGSICFLDRDNRILFSGDTVNNSIILMRQPDNNTVLIEKFCRTLKKLWAYEKYFDRLAIGLVGPFIDKGIINDYLVLTEGLIDGSLSGKYEERGFRKGDVIRYGKAELWYQCDQ